MPGHGDWRVERSKRNCGRISVFKGREAKLNFAIFHILALKGPQTIYNIHRELKTRRGLRHVRYASVNKRVRSLEESGYVKKIGSKKTKAGFEASIYELSDRAFLAMLLDLISLDKLVMKANDQMAKTLVASLIGVL